MSLLIKTFRNGILIYLFFLSEPNVGVPGVYFSLYTLVVTVVTVSVSVTLSFPFTGLCW